jgi:hypothetical protein
MIIYVDKMIMLHANLASIDPIHRKQACHHHQHPEQTKKRKITKYISCGMRWCEGHGEDALHKIR